MIPILGMSVWLIVKIFAILAFLIYLLFALVIVRQVRLMTETIQVGFETPLKFLSYVHLTFAGVVLLLALIIL